MSQSNYSTREDRKLRFGGILENPYVSKIQRHCLDGFRVKNISRVLKNINFQNILDVGCGVGEYAMIKRGFYVGVDNSFSRVDFASKWYKTFTFLNGDAVNLPFKDGAFDTVLLANTAHHLSDEDFLRGLAEMHRVSKRYVIIEDCIRTEKQNLMSRLFYKLDRGNVFRSVADFQILFQDFTDMQIMKQEIYRTFPGLYTHAVFILEKS